MNYLCKQNNNKKEFSKFVLNKINKLKQAWLIK